MCRDAEEQLCRKSKSTLFVINCLRCPVTLIFFPIQVGASLSANRFPGMLYDDTGDSISDKNRSYCELTAQYWAWKNDAAAWQGIFHTGVTFLLTHVRRRALPESILAGRTACLNVQRHNRCAVRVTIRRDWPRFLEAFDVIAPVPENMGMTAARQYETAPHHYAADLTIVRELLRRGDPRDWRAAEEYLNGTNLYFGNLFLMRRPLFERYSAWLFDLLAKYDEQKNVSGYSPQAQRVDGYLAERLFGVYLTRLRAEGTAVGFVPRLHFAGMESRGAYLKQRAETLLLPPGSVRRNAARRLLRKI